MAAFAKRQSSTRADRVPNEDRVRYLFAVLRVVADIQPHEIGAGLEQHAIDRGPGWKRQFKARLDEYEQLHRLNLDQKSHLMRRMRMCEESPNLMRAGLLLAAWSLVLATLCNLSWLLAPQPVLYLVTLGLTGLLGYATAATLSIFDHEVSTAARWQRRVLCSTAGAFAVAVSMLVPDSAMLITQSASKRSFQLEREAYAADPRGFEAIRKLASDTFGVNVVLGGVDQSWSLTSVRVPEASVASMGLGSGFCTLNFSPNRIHAGFGGGSGVDPALWVRGVAIHELGHCVDTWRDLALAASRKVATHSIAPVQATKVSDINDYLAATEEPATQQWREVFSDIFLVGYWRLSAPDQAPALIDALVAHRDANAQNDRVHYTTCWVNLARRSPLPDDLKGLLAWTDSLRDDASCQLTAKPAHRAGIKARLRDLLGLD